MRNFYLEIHDIILAVFYNGVFENNYQEFICEFFTFIVVALIVLLPFYIVYKFIRGWLF